MNRTKHIFYAELLSKEKQYVSKTENPLPVILLLGAGKIDFPEAGISVLLKWL